MTAAQLKKYLKNMFDKKEEELADEIYDVKQVIHKQRVLEEFRKLNIKVVADVELEHLEEKYGGYDSDWSYRLSNTIKTLSIFQDTKEHPINLNVVYELMRSIIPQDYPPVVHLKEEELERLKKNHFAILGNISGMPVKQAVIYLESLGIPIVQDEPKQQNSLLAPIDLNFISEIYRKGESSNDTKEQEDC